MPGRPGRFLQMAFYVSPASAQLLRTKYGLDKCVTLIWSNRWRGGRAKCGG